MELTTQQKECFDKVKHFLNDPDTNVFILKGYAGTGKTFLLNIISQYLNENELPFKLMAPTGRAAKVLRSKVKVQNATTIHKAIYSFSHVKVNEENDRIEFVFPLDINDENFICIVDEASMVNSRKTNNELFRFGTGILLDDLLNYAKVMSGGKVIFVGDPMQLPPVGDNESNALSESYFGDLGLKSDSFLLTDIVRQDKNSLVLKNAMTIRDLLMQQERNELVLAKDGKEVMDLPMLDVPNYYCNKKNDTAAVICFSNRQAFDYNVAIRKILFPEAKHVEVGDKLMVVNNSYFNNYELLNGDIITVVEVSDNIEMQSAPIWKVVNGSKQRETVSLAFRKISFQTDGGNILTRYIHESLLESRVANLMVDQIKALYVNTVMRLREKYPKLDVKSDEFTSAIMEDEIYNALHVKYGYAFTCHKAQGGEWDTTFIDFARRTGLDSDSLRWKYTAITRTRNRLWCVNLPDITPLASLKITSIVKSSKMASEALSFGEVMETPYHKENVPVGVKMKYWSVSHNLEEAGYKISDVKCKPYRDTYEVDTAEGTVRVDCLYNAAGVFTRYETVSTDQKLLALFKDEANMTYAVHYTPSLEFLHILHNRMLSLCDELDIVITNVVEANYKVTYYLKTSGNYASMCFYFNAKGFVTYASPLSDIGAEDFKLNQLIQKLK